MIRNLAQRITDYLIQKNVIEEQDKEIYVYGFDLMVSGLLNILLVLLAGLVSGKLWQAVIFIFIMVSVRMFIGGYHADTHLMCNVAFVLTFVLSVIALGISGRFQAAGAVWLLNSIGLLCVVMLAPLENRNKPLSLTQKKQNRRIGITIYLMCMGCAAILNIIGKIDAGIYYGSLSDAGLYIQIVLIVIAVLLALGKGKEVMHNVEEDFKGHGAGSKKNSGSSR